MNIYIIGLVVLLSAMMPILWLIAIRRAQQVQVHNSTCQYKRNVIIVTKQTKYAGVKKNELCYVQ